MRSVVFVVAIVAIISARTVEGFSSMSSVRKSCSKLAATRPSSDTAPNRRQVLGTFLSTATAAIVSSAKPAVAEGDIFQSLAFNYRGGSFGGLSAEDVGEEPSITYKEFIEKLRAGEVTFVEFLAPDGDKAYATLRDPPNTRIRVGEGYPVEKHDGYSSPLFAIRCVKDQRVPYKFIVPSLPESFQIK